MYLPLREYGGGGGGEHGILCNSLSLQIPVIFVSSSYSRNQPFNSSSLLFFPSYFHYQHLDFSILDLLLV